MKHWAAGDIAWKATGGSAIRSALVDSGNYTPNLASDEFRTAIPSIAQVQTSGDMTLIDAATDGVCDASDVTFTATSGVQCEFIVVYRNVGAQATDMLLLLWDTASGLPVTLGGDVTISWDNGPNRICKI
jgi:hypothetical protein